MVEKMSVRIVKLESMHVAYALGFGTGPEMQAWNMLFAWADKKGLLKDLHGVRFFGFNNPNPSPGSPNYGYEQWMTLSADVTGEGEVKIKEIAAASYAVTRCTLQNIGEKWQALVTWVEESDHRMSGSHPCLEECLTPEIFLPGAELSETEIFAKAEFDLYLPVNE
jgi:DNA gyrase inhibitor GyrI